MAPGCQRPVSGLDVHHRPLAPAAAAGARAKLKCHPLCRCDPTSSCVVLLAVLLPLTRVARTQAPWQARWHSCRMLPRQDLMGLGRPATPTTSTWSPRVAAKPSWSSAACKHWHWRVCIVCGAVGAIACSRARSRCGARALRAGAGRMCVYACGWGIQAAPRVQWSCLRLLPFGALSLFLPCCC